MDAARPNEEPSDLGSSREQYDLQSHASTSGGMYHHEQASGNHTELEKDLFTNAFVSALGVPSTKAAHPVMSHGEMACSLTAVIAVTTIQLLMAWAVYLHVYNDLIMTKTRPLLTAYEMFIGTNITIPLGTVEALCGKWEDQEMKDFAMGPLSTMNMPDGSVYSADESYSFFYNLKQPTRSWDYGRLGSERSVLDDVMFVLSEGVTFNPATPSGYSLLFILVLSTFLFSIFVETRSIFKFTGMLFYFNTKPRPKTIDDVWAFDKDLVQFSLQAVPMRATLVGITAMLCKMIVACALCVLGTVFLLFTSLKIDLILNGLAILFVLGLDEIIFYATVPAQRQRFISDIAPIVYKHKINEKAATAASMGPVMMFPATFGCAVIVRWYQCVIFGQYFRMTAAICLFAGPTIPFADHAKIAPVAGFCDSLLGVSCAPHVEPLETAKRHGYCVITDQTTMTRPTLQYYLDDPSLFANRVNGDVENSWIDWGRSNPKLFKSQHWMDGPYQDLLRKNCLQIYQKDTKPDDVLVDDDVGETMDGAPFWCKREPVFDAMFGGVRDAMNNVPTDVAITKIANLKDPAVIKAVDGCAKTEKKKKEKKGKNSQKVKAEDKDDDKPNHDGKNDKSSPGDRSDSSEDSSAALYNGDSATAASTKQSRKRHRVMHLRHHSGRLFHEKED